ncbi:MAG: OFA family MFS transporter [Lachnospiraceae bacterium]|nr:OFA family MFS transporter [Lachnospiraceae bacterium]
MDKMKPNTSLRWIYLVIGVTAMLFAGFLAASGFTLTGFLHNASVVMLYMSYGVIASTGIGIAYNVLIFVIL